MPAPGQYLATKRLLPSELRSKEWEAARVDYWVMERVYTMAGTATYEQLDAYRQQAIGIANGTLTEAEARKNLRGLLTAQGYQPEAGLAGTIKDLSTTQRMQGSLRTNVDMARGYKYHQQMVGNVLYPAQELYRNRQSRVPRDWDERWAQAAATVGWVGVAQQGMIALTDSPIWIQLSRFGTPYPPYDYGSGMWTRPVKWRVAEQLGLVGATDYDRIRAEAPGSYNEDAVVPARITDDQVRQQLADQLDGIAEWEGDALRLIDRNGSRPYAADDVGRVITSRPAPGVPEELSPNYQAVALAEWLDNPEAFRSDALPGDRAALDVIQDASMLLSRITPDKDITTLSADVTLTAADLEQLQAGRYALPLSRLGVMASPVTAGVVSGTGNARLIIEGARTARRIDAAAAAIGADVAPGTSVLLGGSRYQVRAVDTSVSPPTITLREL